MTMRRLGAVLFPILLALAACGGDEGTSSPSEPDPLAGGKRVFDGACKVCHGASGRGGVGPALDQVDVTFPDCEEQIRWIALGSARWKDEVGPTYGAAGTTVSGAMPSFEGNLSDDEIRLVAAWERAEFAGEDPGAAAGACGVVGQAAGG